MKNFSAVVLLSILFLLPAQMQAQKTPKPFFDPSGQIRIQTTELDALADTIAVVYHRHDDIVWSRVVYRIIDMRDKQNYQLYFPVRPDNPYYRNLFKVILDGVCGGGLTPYERGRELKPKYDMILEPADLRANSILPKERDTDPNSYLIEVDAAGSPYINNDVFAEYSKDLLKYVIQEVVFFNKHTSRMYSKIMGIAPLYSANPDKVSARNGAQSLQFSILFWVLFDELRPFLARQYVIPNGNETQRLTFDEFFAQKLYAHYLLGDDNVYTKMLLDYEKIVDVEVYEEFIKKEQQRIETEMLNFEQDLWEY